MQRCNRSYYCLLVGTDYFDKQRSSNRIPTTTMRLLISVNESSSNHHMLQEKAAMAMAAPTHSLH